MADRLCESERHVNQAAGVAPLCNSCMERPSTLVCNCGAQHTWTICGDPSCTTIAKKKHQKIFGGKDMVLVPIVAGVNFQVAARREPDVCTEHGDQMKLFCVDCQKPVCANCLLVGVFYSFSVLLSHHVFFNY